MSKQKYVELIDQVCKECDIDDPQSMYDVCDLIVMDVAFTLLYRDAFDGIVIFCEYGEVPEENRAAILQSLLEANTYTFDFNTPCFLINPDTKHVLLRAHMLLDGLTAQDLLTTLGSYAMTAGIWRKTYHLDGAAGSEGGGLPNESLPPKSPLKN
ncbi:MAG: CesT family type III secretion system chaperone [Pseudomonadota bacterium]